MEAQMGGRVEPVTYWFRLGDRAIDGISSFDARMVQLRFALSGHVPDGLLFRVSSIDKQRSQAFMRHEQFVADLLAEIGPAGRVHLVGNAAR
jgi:EpsI family protein